jgi:mannose-1-phosphate guanylyltransferase
MQSNGPLALVLQKERFAHQRSACVTRRVVMSKSENLHAIILASGDDHRLKALAAAVSGRDMPKQFAFIAGGGSLLQQTVARYAGLVPPERMVVVVASACEAVARTQLAQWPGIDIIARPLACGAGLDLLLALGRVFSRAPDARVVVTPADHYVPRPEALVDAVVAATKALDEAAVVLVGVAGGRRRNKHMWIVPGKPLAGGILSVAGLVERASPLQAAQFAAGGALENTSMVVARVEHLWYLAARQLPMQAEAVAHLWSGRPSLAGAGATACLDIPVVELRGALLRGATDLAVIPVHGSGCTEWTSVEEVMDSIEDAGELDRLLSRILARQRACGRTELRRRAPANSRHATAA